MALTPAQAALSIAVMAGVTFLTRFLPFLLFDRGGKPPRIVLYLGRVLPPEYLFFGGDGKHNTFRTEWDGGEYWDWSWPSPYES